jgi:hypothetical protein
MGRCHISKHLVCVTDETVYKQPSQNTCHSYIILIFFCIQFLGELAIVSSSYLFTIEMYAELMYTSNIYTCYQFELPFQFSMHCLLTSNTKLL